MKSTVQNIHKNKLNVRCITNITENKKCTEKSYQDNYENSLVFEKSGEYEDNRRCKLELIQSIQNIFELPKEKAITLVSSDKMFRNARIDQMSKVVQTLFDNGVKSDTILENHFVLIMSHGK